MLTEALDEGLLVLRHLMRWHMIDVAYVKMRESGRPKTEWTAANGTTVATRPDYHDLPVEVRPEPDQWLSYSRKY